MAISLRDDLNRVLTLSAPARRIVSLSPAATENLFAIGAGQFVVGVTAADTYPVAVSKLPRIGDFGTPRYEMIRALKPDLLIAESGTLRADTLNIISERAKVSVFAQVSARYSDVGKHLRQLATLTGLPDGAKKGIATLRSGETAARRIAQGRKTVRTFLEISRTPLYAAGPGSFLDDLLRIAGGVNVVRTREPYPMVSRESLLVADPEVYIVTVPGASEQIRTAPALPSPLDTIRAAKENRVYALPIDLLFRPTPRLAKGLYLLAKALHQSL
ncbi:MAG: ABC transporter substrate-binding protein [Akkermansiaceae bacterium]|nr:ABC transporter substrate-binding protein [Armatimonadota bacterium]